MSGGGLPANQAVYHRELQHTPPFIAISWLYTGHTQQTRGIDPMLLGQRRRRWANIETASGISTNHLYNIYTTSSTLVQHCINVIRIIVVCWVTGSALLFF